VPRQSPGAKALRGLHRIAAAVVFGALLSSLEAAGAGQATAPRPLQGQIIADPADAAALVRHGGGSVYLCGPGDPEDFLYRGSRRPDGTREGGWSQTNRRKRAALLGLAPSRT